MNPIVTDQGADIKHHRGPTVSPSAGHRCRPSVDVRAKCTARERTRHFISRVPIRTPTLRLSVFIDHSAIYGLKALDQRTFLLNTCVTDTTFLLLQLFAFGSLWCNENVFFIAADACGRLFYGFRGVYNIQAAT